MQMNVAVSRVASHLRDEIGIGFRWSTTRAEEAINDAVMKWALLTGAHRSSWAAPSGIGAKRYALPDPAMRVERVEFNNLPLFPTTTKGLDDIDEAWRSAANGTPTHYVVDPPGTFFLYPPPKENLTIRIGLLDAPVDVTGASVLGVPEVVARTAIVPRAVAALLQADGHDQRAAKYDREFSQAALAYLGGAYTMLSDEPPTMQVPD